MRCVNCDRPVSRGERRCRAGTGCRRFIGSGLTVQRGPGPRSRAPACPGCDDNYAVVLYRPSGVPWYGGPWRPRSWRCVACKANFRDEDVARAERAG